MWAGVWRGLLRFCGYAAVVLAQVLDGYLCFYHIVVLLGLRGGKGAWNFALQGAVVQ